MLLRFPTSISPSLHHLVLTIRGVRTDNRYSAFSLAASVLCVRGLRPVQHNPMWDTARERVPASPVSAAFTVYSTPWARAEEEGEEGSGDSSGLGLDAAPEAGDTQDMCAHALHDAVYTPLSASARFRSSLTSLASPASSKVTQQLFHSAKTSTNPAFSPQAQAQTNDKENQGATSPDVHRASFEQCVLTLLQAVYFAASVFSGSCMFVSTGPRLQVESSYQWFVSGVCIWMSCLSSRQLGEERCAFADREPRPARSLLSVRCRPRLWDTASTGHRRRRH